MVPEGWDVVAANTICERISVGIVVKPKDYYVPEGEGIRAFRSANVREGAIEDRNWVYISDEGHRKNKKSELQAGDVLVVRTGYPGTACVVTDEYAGSNCIDIIFARADRTQVLPEFLCMYINSEFGKQQVLDNQGGLAQQHFNVGSFNVLKVPLPPLAEQKRIAEVLGVWDRATLVAGKQLDLARTQKRALMQTLLTPTRRFPGYEGQPWKDIPFNEVFDRIRRKNTVGSENVLTISGQDGLVSQSDYFNKRVAAKDLSGYTLLHGGDFAYNKSYSNGYPMGAIKVLSDGQSGVVSSLYLCFHIKDETQHSRDFFRHYFEAGRHEQEISLIAQEGARNHGLLNVGVSDFFETYLHVPDYPEQCRIAEVIGAAEDAEQHAQTQITRLQAEKKALMQQLLTGQKRLVT